MLSSEDMINKVVLERELQHVNIMINRFPEKSIYLSTKTYIQERLSELKE